MIDFRFLFDYNITKSPFVLCDKTKKVRTNHIMTCMNCGATIQEDQKFCTWCGLNTRLADSAPTQKKRKVTHAPVAIFLIVTILLSVLGPLAYVIWNSIPTRVSLDLGLRSYYIEDFMEQIVPYIDRSEYEITAINANSWGSYGLDSRISTQVIVKPKGEAPVTICLNFVGSYDDGISGISVEYSPDDSQKEFLCKNAVLKALEKAICGKSFASNATDQLDSVGAALSRFDETTIDSYF